MKREGTLSVVIPAFNEESNIQLAEQTISKILENNGIAYRIFFVDDGSTDATWAKIQEAAQRNPNVSGLHFSRNFGKESSVFAGLSNVDTECCVVIDADLQHPPEKMVDMYRLWEEGYDIVEGVKKDRGDESIAHRGAANTFYNLIGQMTGMELQNTSDYKLLDREVVNIISHLPERNMFFRAMSFWVGFRRTEVEYEVRERASGETKWSTRKLIKYALNNIASFSTFPMQIVTWLGIICTLFGVLFAIISLVQKLMGYALGGFTTVIVLIGFTGGIIMISLGIIGYYIAKIYAEVQHRPRFIISKTCGDINNHNKKLVG